MMRSGLMLGWRRGRFAKSLALMMANESVAVAVIVAHTETVMKMVAVSRREGDGAASTNNLSGHLLMLSCCMLVFAILTTSAASPRSMTASAR